jgi:hypothetical protein
MDDFEGLSAVWTTISLVFTEAHRHSPASPAGQGHPDCDFFPRYSIPSLTRDNRYAKKQLRVRKLLSRSPALEI